MRARGSLDVVQQALDTHGVIVRPEEILKMCDGVDIGSDLAVAEQIPEEVRRVAEVFQRDAHFVPFGVREFDKSLSALSGRAYAAGSDYPSANVRSGFVRRSCCSSDNAPRQLSRARKACILSKSSVVAGSSMIARA